MGDVCLRTTCASAKLQSSPLSTPFPVVRRVQGMWSVDGGSAGGSSRAGYFQNPKFLLTVPADCEIVLALKVPAVQVSLAALSYAWVWVLKSLLSLLCAVGGAV